MVARDERTNRDQVARAFAIAGDELVARREDRPPRRLSFDEAHHRRGRELATVVSDLDRRRVIEVLPGCQRKVIQRWLTALPDELRAGVDVLRVQFVEGGATDARRLLRTGAGVPPDHD